MSSVEARTKTKRSIPLTLLLGVFTLANAWFVVSSGLQWYSIVSHGKRNPEIPLFTAAGALVTLVLLIFVWLWKRWAVYVLGLLMVVSVIFVAVMGGLSWSLAITVVLVAATAWFIRAQWLVFR